MCEIKLIYLGRMSGVSNTRAACGPRGHLCGPRCLLGIFK